MKIKQKCLKLIIYTNLNILFNFLSIDDNLIVEKDASIGEIDKKNFEEAIGGNLNNILQRNESSHEVKKKRF